MELFNVVWEASALCTVTLLLWGAGAESARQAPKSTSSKQRCTAYLHPSTHRTCSSVFCSRSPRTTVGMCSFSGPDWSVSGSKLYQSDESLTRRDHWLLRHCRCHVYHCVFCCSRAFWSYLNQTPISGRSSSTWYISTRSVSRILQTWPLTRPRSPCEKSAPKYSRQDAARQRSIHSLAGALSRYLCRTWKMRSSSDRLRYTFLPSSRAIPDKSCAPWVWCHVTPRLQSFSS